MLKPLLLLLEGIWNRAQIVCLEKSTIMAQDTLIIYFITLVNGRLLFYLCVARLCVCVCMCECTYWVLYVLNEYLGGHMSSCTHTIIEKDARCPDTFTTLHLMPLRQDSHWSWNKMVASTPTSSFCLCSLHTVLGLRHLCCHTCLFMRYLDLSSSGLHSKCFYPFKHLSCSYVWKVFNNGCITEMSLEGYFIPGPSPQLFLLTEI